LLFFVGCDGDASHNLVLLPSRLHAEWRLYLARNGIFAKVGCSLKFSPVNSLQTYAIMYLACAGITNYIGKMKTILIICCVYEKKVISAWATRNPAYKVIIDVVEEYVKDGVQKRIFDRIHRYKNRIERFDGVVGTNDLPSLVASILARELHLRGPSPESIDSFRLH
jgi:hypothetical protein